MWQPIVGAYFLHVVCNWFAFVRMLLCRLWLPHLCCDYWPHTLCLILRVAASPMFICIPLYLHFDRCAYCTQYPIPSNWMGMNDAYSGKEMWKSEDWATQEIWGKELIGSVLHDSYPTHLHTTTKSPSTRGECTCWFLRVVILPSTHTRWLRRKLKARQKNFTGAQALVTFVSVQPPWPPTMLRNIDDEHSKFGGR